MPRQWIYIALYMVLAYLAFAAAIEIARRQVAAEDAAMTAEREAVTREPGIKDGEMSAP